MRINQAICENLKNYPYLCNIHLERRIEGEDCYDYELTLEFCNIPHYYVEDKIRIVFLNVKNLKMQNLDGLFYTDIVVKDLKNHQLENINYYVEESEENMFSFYCSSIELDINSSKEV